MNSTRSASRYVRVGLSKDKDKRNLESSKSKTTHHVQGVFKKINS